MKIKKTTDNGILSIAISDRIDTTTAPTFETELKNSFDNIESLILDFAEVNYISSAGLRVLLSAHKVMSKKGGMKLINVGEPIMEIFEVTGFNEILDIE